MIFNDEGKVIVSDELEKTFLATHQCHLLAMSKIKLSLKNETETLCLNRKRKSACSASDLDTIYKKQKLRNKRKTLENNYELCDVNEFCKNFGVKPIVRFQPEKGGCEVVLSVLSESMPYVIIKYGANIPLCELRTKVAVAVARFWMIKSGLNSDPDVKVQEMSIKLFRKFHSNEYIINLKHLQGGLCKGTASLDAVFSLQADIQRLASGAWL